MGKRTERSKRTYDQMAAGYNTSPEGYYTQPHKAELIKQVILHDGDSILDVACGNGTLLGALSRKARVNAFGVDLSKKMIAAARERYPDCTFVVSSCVPLPFENESMDVITVSCAFHHFEDPYAFAGECMRVLKKNGMVYMAEPFFTPVIRWLANTVVFPFSKSGDVKVYSERELRGMFETAGFRDIRTYTKGTVLFFSAKK
ncbi:class I SAM-dependent methyltransferase [Faecalispora jeddahensis]|uniref:class I SAM-dependent methyltransferase n=1 Tax=Faecalispora jeddahensis TaxID=1414721 RepID=UPI00189C2FDA|nr:methyltransferase domain-containing protein [Faecalispora jeddahensis]